MQNAHHERSGDPSTILLDPVLVQSPFGSQAVLFREVFRDDVVLLESGEGEWLRAVRQIDWKTLRPVAAQYYQALWEFNIEAARKRGLRPRVDMGTGETRRGAAQRLLFERPTGGNTEAPVLHPAPTPPLRTPMVNVDLLEPGVVPIRIAGRTPKCFFALVKAFIGVHLMGKAGSAEEVEHHLRVSPPFARACGFTLPDPAIAYRHTDIPSLRKLEQFDEIMSSRALWSEIAKITVRENLARGLIPISGQDLVEDTTHYVAYSAMDQVRVPPVAPAAAEPPSAEIASAAVPRNQRSRPGKVQRRLVRRAAKAEKRRRWRERRALERQKRRARHSGRRARTAATPGTAGRGSPVASSSTDVNGKTKSQSRTVKACRCEDRQQCPHPWIQSDPGAGTVVKGGRGGKRRYWAHKAAVLSTGPDAIPLDAVAMSDAASHDSTALVPHLDRLFATYPDLIGKFTNVVADSAWDDAELKQTVEERFGLNLKTPVNPRSIKSITEDLGRGMKSLSPAGTLTCQADREMSYAGASYQRETFIYHPPRLDSGEVACTSCPFRDICCRRDNTKGRQVELPFTTLPHIDPGDAPMGRRFKAIMARRTAVERAIKRIKLDFGDARLTRRGNDAFQAHLDRSLIAFHWMLRLDR
jgi:hypothetical protein